MPGASRFLLESLLLLAVLSWTSPEVSSFLVVGQIEQVLGIEESNSMESVVFTGDACGGDAGGGGGSCGAGATGGAG